MEITKTQIYCFSGTGNTKRTALCYQQELQATEIIDIPTTKLPSDNDTLLGFGFPIHAFRTPEVVIRFLQSLPEGHNHCFLFMTSGEGLSINNGAPALALTILRKKGYQILSVRHYLMPYNMVYRQSDQLAKLMDLTMQERVHTHSLLLKQAIVEDTTIPLWNRMFSSLFRIEWWYARHPHFSVDRKACNHCGLCVKTCPVGNIRFKEGKITFSNHCTLCVRCAFFCPQEAIHLGLLDGMRVTGSYHLDKLETDDTVKADWDDGTKLAKKLYQHYFS